ncbi:hypothetical protein ACS0TY_011177 [Phlomoides rotata]
MEYVEGPEQALLRTGDLCSSICNRSGGEPIDLSVEKWRPPPRGRLKLNSDAGIFYDGTVGMGFVVRDWEGQLVLAGAKRCLVASDSSFLIEALALRFGVLSVIDRGLKVDLLETDS